MQISRERPDKRGRVPPPPVTWSGTDALAWAQAGGSPTPRGGGGYWWLPCTGSWGRFGGFGCGCSCSTRRRLANHLGCVHPCSEAVQCCEAMGCSVLVWGHLGADTQLPLSACGTGKGMAFGSLFPALLHPCQLGLGSACSPGPAAGTWGAVGEPGDTPSKTPRVSVGIK